MSKNIFGSGEDPVIQPMKGGEEYFFHETNYYFFRSELDTLREYLDELDEGENPKKAFGLIKKRMDQIISRWEDFEDHFFDTVDYNELEILGEYGAEIDDNQAYWEKNRTKQSENYDESEEDKYLEILVTYNKEEDKYFFEMGDELYRLDIEAKRENVMGIIGLLYELSSKFDFRGLVNLDKEDIEDEKEFLESVGVSENGFGEL